MPNNQPNTHSDCFMSEKLSKNAIILIYKNKYKI